MPLNIPTRHNEKLRALVAAIDADQELAQWWKCANVNVVDRQGMTDHGEVHIRIVCNAAIKLLRLLADAGIHSSIEETYQMTADDAEVVGVLVLIPAIVAVRHMVEIGDAYENETVTVPFGNGYAF